jgi:hypothetical protein
MAQVTHCFLFGSYTNDSKLFQDRDAGTPGAPWDIAGWKPIRLPLLGVHSSLADATDATDANFLLLSVEKRKRKKKSREKTTGRPKIE